MKRETQEDCQSDDEEKSLFACSRRVEIFVGDPLEASVGEQSCLEFLDVAVGEIFNFEIDHELENLLTLGNVRE